MELAEIPTFSKAHKLTWRHGVNTSEHGVIGPVAGNYQQSPIMAMSTYVH